MTNTLDELLPQGDRLQILSPEEYELLWGFPKFSSSDQQLFFAMASRKRGVFEGLRTARTRLHFLLHLGYFKARQRFFVIDEDLIGRDIDYLRAQYLNGRPVPNLAVSKHTRLQHVSRILELFGFRQITDADRVDLEQRALQAARISSRPLYVLRDLVDRLRQQRIVLPGYTYLQDVVRRALLFERDRLSDALATAMSREDRRLLDALLRDDGGLHAITSIKHHPGDFSLKQLLTEIQRGERLRGLSMVSPRVIAQTELSAESVRFYASLVDYYTAYKLKRMNPTRTSTRAPRCCICSSIRRYPMTGLLG